MTVDELIALEPGELVIIKPRSEVDNPIEKTAFIDSMETYVGGVFVVSNEIYIDKPGGYAWVHLDDENGERLPCWWYSSFLEKYKDDCIFKEEATDEEIEVCSAGSATGNTTGGFSWAYIRLSVNRDRYMRPRT